MDIGDTFSIISWQYLIWKCANISPIYKKGRKDDVNNYRPVSLTCICKILESIIRDKVMEHFTINKLFTNRQFGFLKGRSTVTQLLQILDDWTETLESGGRIDVIYTDFEKAFDKVPHRRLLSKLKSYKIHNSIIEWIKNILSGRKQRVRVDGEFSSWADVLSGIPLKVPPPANLVGDAFGKRRPVGRCGGGSVTAGTTGCGWIG